MKTENAILMKMARESLRGKWGISIGASVIFMVIMMVIQIVPFVGFIAYLAITGPMSLGLIIFFLSLSRNQEVEIGQLFKGFENFGTSLVAYLLMCLFIFLWTLLLIIPGMIASLAYSMTFYIIADNNSIGAMDAIKKSKEMMQGNKWKLFCLYWRFFGWSLLCLLTLGIGYLWLVPYIQTSIAKFYDDIKGNQTNPSEQSPIQQTPTPAV
ncbi:MAG: hypothetical protein US30_C0005G0014 [Candidatus Moranbacteria bacterium GW2011_GWF2_36_839]|nr:MAG: hypothetical protein US27_C0005G0040 [Candidatus Moranbacteria bacterium GW2011_GWF1_36_78]KKQ17201.1 MAG: hypothetical protein US30_C0005G0014 [Candidatus Moranbacteria bacterium GW2011_GWF2_36_839]HAT73720.1 hypothetical protein [Candidatus Moranbacteria bacterium]HBY11291.1 hypothetical protein [Candidatus Moranbacteria bacterium]